MIVVDASLVIEIILATTDGKTLLKRLRASGEPLLAPELLDLEILQVLRRQVRKKYISDAQAEAGFSLLADLPIERFGHRMLASRIWQLRDNLTAYDASYIALAELFSASVWTRDTKLTNVPGSHAAVELV